MEIKYGNEVIEVKEREAEIWNRLVMLSMSGSTGDIGDFADLGSRQSVGGVISSLIQKDLVWASDLVDFDRSGSVDLWPCHPEHGATFWCDCTGDDEAKSLLAA